jgi:hypothetical protein
LSSYRYDALGGAIKYGPREGAREGRRRERGVRSTGKRERGGDVEASPALEMAR